MDDFERELKVGFLDEAAAAVADVEQAFLVLESNPDDGPTLDKIFRLAHNLKGSSKAVGFDEMGAFTHEFESLLLKLKNKELSVSSGIVNLLLRCNDQVSQMIEGLRQDLNATFDSTALLHEINEAKSGKVEEPEAKSENKDEISAQEVARLESFLENQNESSDAFTEIDITANLNSEGEFAVNHELLAEIQEQITSAEVQEAPHEAPQIPTTPEPISAAPEAKVIDLAQAKLEAKPISETKPKPAAAPAKASASDENIRVSLAKLEKLLNYVGEMVILQAVLGEQTQSNSSLLLKKTVHQLGKVGKEIQDISMSLRMVPVKPTFQKMQRIVRDTAQALDKDILLELLGEETELDKTVLEKINDPLVHLIRNSVDHGIESKEKRLQSGKNPQGHVTLSAAHEAGKLVLRVADDGGGIDAEKLKKKAIEKGIIKPNAVLTEKEAVHLIFAPGFSTKELVTDVSGRGVGMDVVRTNIEELGGEIQIETKLGQGSTFTVYLPLTLAIIDGMVVKVGEEKYVIPLSHVHESVKPHAADLKQTTGLGDIFMLRGENLPVFHLAQALRGKKPMPNPDAIAMVIRSGPQPFALMVDDIIGQYQVVIKQLGPELHHLAGVIGSTILGDGRPSLIIEPAELIKKELRSAGSQKDTRRLA